MYDWSMESNHYSENFGGKNSVVRVWAGGTSTTPNFIAAHFARQNTKFGGGKRGRAKIPSPNPPFYPSVVLTKEGLFARPRFPPPNFVFRFAKCAAEKYGVVFAPPSHAHTTEFLLPKILTNNIYCSIILIVSKD